MKRLLAALLLTTVLSLPRPAPGAPIWTETELPHAWCYALDSAPANCLPKAPEPSPTPSALPPTATPTATATKTQPPPIMTPSAPELVNGDFESGFAGWQTIAASGLAAGDVYHAVAHDSATSLWWIDHYRCWRSGVRQTVLVTPLTRLRFSAWGRTWAGGNLDLSAPSDLTVNDGLMVGIDPNGGADYRATAINWSTEFGTERWQPASIVAAALGNRITVYILLNLGVSGAPGQPGAGCEWGLPTLAGWLDEARLEVLP